MESVENLYNEGKLLVRAMNWPQLTKSANGLCYDCTVWADEFCLLMNDALTSVSSTLILPNVGVSTYKNIGFLINSDLADCFHIAKSDSGSCGNIIDGDFSANEPDFETIAELANHIKTNNDINMNEVNINATIDSVVGLFFNECLKQEKLLQMIYVVRKCLEKLTGITYPIYSYNRALGKLNKIELSPELEDKIVESLENIELFYWPEEYDEPVIDTIESGKGKKF